GGKRVLRVGDRAPSQRVSGVGAVAHPLDRGTDLRLAEQMPALERGSREEHAVGGSHDPLGDDSCDAQSSLPERGPTGVSLSQSRWIPLIGQLLSLAGHTAFCWSVAFSPDGSRLASASWDGTIRIWDARPWTPEGHLEHESLRTKP